MKKEHIIYTCNTLCKIFRDLPLKLFSLLVPIYAFFFGNIEHPVALALATLIIFDFITGVGASYKTQEQIKSAKIFRSAIKFLLYFLMVSAAHLAQRTNPSVLGFLENTVIGFLAITELISIIENIGKVGFIIPQKLLNKLEDLRDN